MAARLESIGRISPEGISKIRKSFAIEEDESWIQNVKVSLSSYFDIAVVSRKSKALILQPKFVPNPVKG